MTLLFGVGIARFSTNSAQVDRNVSDSDVLLSDS
jgi:hypothetical protein